jgi:hypothetical protein
VEAAMGRITIDGRPSDVAIPAAGSVADAYEVVTDHVRSLRRAVVIVRHEGRTIQWGDGSPVWSAPFGPDSSLEIQTTDPVSLSASMLAHLEEFLPTVATEHRRAAEALRIGDKQPGIERVLNVIPWWKEIRSAAVNVCGLLTIDLTSPPWIALGHDLHSAGERTDKLLDELREAVELDDFVLVADLLEYELAPLVESWQQICRDLAAGIRERFPDAGGKDA